MGDAVSQSRTPAKPSFEDLVDAHSREIFAYLWRLLRATEEAEDCLQETYLRAYRAYSRLRSAANLRAWLYRIATNVARTHARRLTRAAARTADLDPDIRQTGLPVAEAFDHRQQLAQLAAAVEALPRKQRAALMMRRYQGLDYASIAQALGSSEEAARANVYQALRKLRATFPR